jgi:hypothetical protein
MQFTKGLFVANGFVANGFAPDSVSIEKFSETLSPSFINQCLEESGVATIRKPGIDVAE